ncbi:MAG: hypothetical protein V3U50_05355 [Acidimicrobiia bacterium]
MNATRRNRLPILLLAAALTMTACDSAATEPITAPPSPSSSTLDIALISQRMVACYQNHGFEASADPTGYSVEVAPNRQAEFDAVDSACMEQLRDEGILPPLRTDDIPATTSIPATTTTTAPEAIVELPSGVWLRTNPDLGGLIVDTRDMIWDGEDFYLLTRIGFGDVIVWQSSDGIEWTEHSQIGTASTVDGPHGLTSVSGQLIAAGWRDGTALAWVHEGDGGWTEVEVGAGVIDRLVFFGGNYVALGRAFYQPGPGQTPGDNYPIIWSSWDGYTWTETVGAGDFESVRALLGLAVGPAGLLTIAFPDDDRVNSISAVVTSTDGIDWVSHQPTGLDDFWQLHGITGNASGYAAYGYTNDEFDSPILVSADGVTWEPIGSPSVSDTEPVGWKGISTFGDYIVLSGEINIDNESHPRVWAYRGGGLWAVLGTGDWYSESGGASAMVSGNGRLVVRAQMGGPATDPWSIFTFVPDSSD